MNINKTAVIAAISIISASIIQAQTEETIEVYHTQQEKRDIANLHLGKGVSIGTLLEVEAAIGNESGKDVSDITLATLEFSIEAELNDWISAKAVLLWEEDDTEPIDLDEGVITLGGTENIAWSLELGKLYIPFGAFHSHFVSDPLTLELGETRKSAAIFGYSHDLFTVRLGSFNGDSDDADSDQVDDLVASVNLTPIDGIEIGGFWVSDLGETDGLTDRIQEATSGSEESEGIAYTKTGGAGGFVHFELAKAIFDAEYITATGDFDAGIIGDDKLTPKAWNFEAAYVIREIIEIAAKYEGTDDFPDMPKAQYGAAGSYALLENTTISLEYLHGTYKGDTKDRDMVTAQIAVEF